MEEKQMTNLERELASLKKEIVGMMELVFNQLERAEKAFTERDMSLAREVHHFEKLVDGADLHIDKECENLIALYNPVAGDLRFVLAASKIISHLERVGDHADKIARYIRKRQIQDPFDKALLKAVRFADMFDLAQEMLEIATQAFIEEDGGLAREVFGLDIQMNEIYSNALTEMHKHASQTKSGNVLYLFSVVNKLERVGDMAKNIAEETVFYLEAKVLKHRKVKHVKEL
ncbi:MAG: phosphate signaling complex protein PhoU [Saprospiraceae bacterium]|nr:phosphate signaling complex protein PhoU [Saprospiraceae bacterium]